MSDRVTDHPDKIGKREYEKGQTREAGNKEETASGTQIWSFHLSRSFRARVPGVA